MFLSMSVPEIKCTRCGVIEPVRPQILRPVEKAPPGAAVVEDSDGGLWLAQGGERPPGWIAGPAGGDFCPECALALDKVLREFSDPLPPVALTLPSAHPVQSAPIRAQPATSTPSRSIPSPNVVRTNPAPSPTPSQVPRSMQGAVTRPAPPASRPTTTSHATLPTVMPMTLRPAVMRSEPVASAPPLFVPPQMVQPNPAAPTARVESTHIHHIEPEHKLSPAAQQVQERPAMSVQANLGGAPSVPRPLKALAEVSDFGDMNSSESDSSVEEAFEALSQVPVIVPSPIAAAAPAGIKVASAPTLPTVRPTPAIIQNDPVGTNVHVEKTTETIRHDKLKIPTFAGGAPQTTSDD